MEKLPDSTEINCSKYLSAEMGSFTFVTKYCPFCPLKFCHHDDDDDDHNVFQEAAFELNGCLTKGLENYRLSEQLQNTLHFSEAMGLKNCRLSYMPDDTVDSFKAC